MKITNCTCPECGESLKGNEAILDSLWPFEDWDMNCMECGEFKVKSEAWDKEITKKEQLKLL